MRWLLILSSKAQASDEQMAYQCQICNKYFPEQLLIAAHVKKRSECSSDERADVENIAMLQCNSCDALFENGFITVNNEGYVIASNSLPLTEDLITLISQVEGNSCSYINGNESRISYMNYHRVNIFQP